jgi:hypothetical protein
MTGLVQVAEKLASVVENQKAFVTRQTSLAHQLAETFKNDVVPRHDAVLKAVERVGDGVQRLADRVAAVDQLLERFDASKLMERFTSLGESASKLGLVVDQQLAPAAEQFQRSSASHAHLAELSVQAASQLIDGSQLAQKSSAALLELSRKMDHSVETYLVPTHERLLLASNSFETTALHLGAHVTHLQESFVTAAAALGATSLPVRSARSTTSNLPYNNSNSLSQGPFVLRLRAMTLARRS